MKIHRILVECNRLEFEDQDPQWFFRLRAEIHPNGEKKLMQTTERFDEKIFREQIVKTFQKMGMDLAQLSILDEGAI